MLKKLAGETALYGLSSILGRFLNVMLVPLYTNLFTKAEYGVVTDFYANAAFIMVLYSYRMESAYFRFGADEGRSDKAYSTALSSILVSSMLILAGMFLMAQPIANWLRYPEHVDYVQYFALILALDCLCELPFARLRYEQKAKQFAVLRLINIGVNLGLNLFWIVFCPWAAKHGWNWVYSVWRPGLGIGYIFISNLVASAVTLLLLFPQLKALRKAAFQFDLWKKMFLYSLPLILASMAGIVNEMLDRAILKYLLPGNTTENLEQVGIYGANYKLAMLISLFTQAYRYAAEPFFFRTARQSDGLYLQAQATKWFTIVTAGGMLGMLLFLDIIKYMIGPEFWTGLHVVPILLMANIALGLHYNFSVWYKVKDRTRTGAWISVAGAMVTIVLNVWLAPAYGYTASAWATLLCYSLMAWLSWQLGRSIYPAPYPLRKMGLYIGVAFVFYLLSTSVKPFIIDFSWIRWGLPIMLFATYWWLVYNMEKDTLRQILKNN